MTLDEEGPVVTSNEWGRVADDGTVYVTTADGERAVGSYPAGTSEEALAFFTERYEALATTYEFDDAFTLADAARAKNEHADAQHFDQ